MSQRVARLLVLACVVAGYGWTAHAWVCRSHRTTSMVVLYLCRDAPIIAVLFGAVAVITLRKLVPQIPWYDWLLLVAALLGIGHIFWPHGFDWD